MSIRSDKGQEKPSDVQKVEWNQKQNMSQNENIISVQHAEDNMASHSIMSNQDLKNAVEEEDDPHIAAFQIDADGPDRLSTSTFIAIFVCLSLPVLHVNCSAYVLISVKVPRPFHCWPYHVWPTHDWAYPDARQCRFGWRE